MREDLLRHIWSKQLFDTTRLVTTDGRAVCIVHSGTLSRISGPDFKDAVLQIGGISYRGDIEFHRTCEDWKLHNHHVDSKYNSVILHVVAQGNAEQTPSQSGREIPTIVLEPFLLSSIENISDQLAREEFSSKKNEIWCASLNEKIENSFLQEWIHLLYQERLQSKVQILYNRLCEIITQQQKMIREPVPPYSEMLDEIPLPDSLVDKNLFKQKLPWEQLLYEEIMDGLGYSNNREPMKKLAESVSLFHIKRHADEGQHLISHQMPKQVRHDDELQEITPLQIQSILFKASGLLPSLNEIHDQESKVYIHQLHSAWNELSNKILLSPLHKTEWNFSPTRPSNFPTLRIAAAGFVLHKLLFQSLFKSLITIVEGKYSSPETKIEQLLQLLECGDDLFWNFHYSFTEATHKRHALLGDSRKYDIIINTIIPFICLYAKIFGKNILSEHCLNVAVALPLLEDNSILRSMNRQLVKQKFIAEFAFQQQGLIHLNKNYCVAQRCNECRIGKTLQLG